jgi:eukaryotic-like serine/threonine-protein kinase
MIRTPPETGTDPQILLRRHRHSVRSKDIICQSAAGAGLAFLNPYSSESPKCIDLFSDVTFFSMSVPAPSIGQILGHYRIVEQIGAGGMGVVYRAHDEQLDRYVALKMLPAGTLADEGTRTRFRKEALALAKLDHPNVATIHEFGSQNGVDFLVTAYVPGITLNTKIDAGALPEAEVISLGIQLAAGLAAAHEQGVIHGDLKPGNLRLTPDGRLKILDFGLARLIEPEGDDTLTATLTKSQGVTGTLPYMAPEQLRGQKADFRSDIWAAGAVLYEMATGERPFKEQTAPALAADIIHKAPPAPRSLKPDMSPGLEAIIRRCLEKEPEKRYQSANQLAIDLRRPQTPGVDQTSAPEAAPIRNLGRGWRLLAFGALAVIVVAVALVGLNLGGVRDRLFEKPAAARIHSIAVLPLENLSGNTEEDYFADGTTDALITELSKVSALRVISRQSVMRYKGSKKPLQEIARELNVDALVEGSVLHSGDRVRVVANLIDASNDQHLWAETFDRKVSDILALQSDFAWSITREVQAKLSSQERARLANTHPINPEAYQLYLKGRYYWYKLNPEGMQKAIEYFQQALEKDPAYAPAYAGLAFTYESLAFFTVLPPREMMPKAKAAAVKALEIDDNLAEAHASLGWAAFTYDLDWPAAGKHLERALVLNPASPLAHSYYSLYLGALGRSEEGLAEAKRALDLDPVSPAILNYVVVQLYMARRFDEAIDQCRKTLELDPSFTPAHGTLGHVYAAKGMYREALAEYEKSALTGVSPASTAFVGYAHARLGQRNQAFRVLDQLRAASKQRYVPALSFAIVYVGLGEKEQAFLWLEKAYEERTNSLAYLKVTATWDPLRSDPRFADLVRRIGLPP